MAEELIDRSAAVRASAERSVPDERGTFPAGTALTLLAVYFVLTRLVVRFAATHPMAARVAMISAVVGAILACAATVRLLVENLRGKPALTIARLILVAPVVALVIAAVGGQPLESVQSAALGGALATVVLSLGVAIARARGLRFARIALACLLIGEVIELGWPPAHSIAVPGSIWPRVFDRAGSVTEIIAIVGSVMALAWAIQSTMRVAGAARTRMFLPMPVIIGVLVSMLATTVPTRLATAVAHSAFGVRFDLLTVPAHVGVPTSWLLLYLLIPELLVCAASISMAGILFDRGAAVRRSLGWLAVLIAGFGALRFAGPMDPIRLALVCLAVVLLERSVTLEAEDRAAS